MNRTINVTMDSIISTIDVVLQLVPKFPFEASDIRSLIRLVFWIPYPFHSEILSAVCLEIPFDKCINLLCAVLVTANPVIEILGLAKVAVAKVLYIPYSWPLHSEDVNAWDVTLPRGILKGKPPFFHQLITNVTSHLLKTKERMPFNYSTRYFHQVLLNVPDKGTN